MIKLLFAFALFQIPYVYGQNQAPAAIKIQSDCTPAEQKFLQQADFAKQFGAVTVHDCTPIKVSADKEFLLVGVVVGTSEGFESYIAFYERAGFSEKAHAIYKSPALGFDLYPLFLKNVHRLFFVHPGSDMVRAAIYMVVQTGPATTRLSRWEFNYEKKELTETTRRWVFDAGILAKIYQDRDVWRALIEVRSVEL